jgi:hypothetical protein
MQTPFNCVTENRGGAALALDLSNIIVRLESVKEVRALPCGSIVGDQQGGLTFSDAVAAALEARSDGGWREVVSPARDTWTVIVLDR